MNQKNTGLSVALLIAALFLSAAVLVSGRYQIAAAGITTSSGWKWRAFRIDTWTGRTWMCPNRSIGWQPIPETKGEYIPASQLP